jgi:hypothetical protein
MRQTTAMLRPKSGMEKGSLVADDDVRLEGREDTVGKLAMGLKGRKKGALSSDGLQMGIWWVASRRRNRGGGVVRPGAPT